MKQEKIKRKKYDTIKEKRKRKGYNTRIKYILFLISFVLNAP